MLLIALNLDNIWPLNRAIFALRKRNFAFEHARAQPKRGRTARAGVEHARAHPLFVEHARAWWTARPCSSREGKFQISRSTARVPYEHGRAGQGARQCSISARPCWYVQRAWLILNASKHVLMIKLYLFYLKMLDIMQTWAIYALCGY